MKTLLPAIIAAFTLAACSSQAGEPSCFEIEKSVDRTQASVDALRAELTNLQRIFPPAECDEQCGLDLRKCMEESTGTDTRWCYRDATSPSRLRMDRTLVDILGNEWVRPQGLSDQASDAWEARRNEAFRGYERSKNGELSIALSEHADALAVKVEALGKGRCGS